MYISERGNHRCYYYIKRQFGRKMGSSPQTSRRNLKMTKTLKKIAAVCMAVIMMVTVLCTYAFASGTVTGTLRGSGTDSYMYYSFDVDGASYSATNNDSHYGQTSKNGFVTSANKRYQITFEGLKVGATVYIFSESTKTQVCSFIIPVYTSGMPTLSYFAELDAGQYYVKVVSNSKDTYSTGSFRVYGITGTYNHTV